MPAGADCEKGGLGSIRRRHIPRSGAHGHNHRRTAGPVPGTWPAHPHRQPQAYDRRKRRNTADAKRNGQHRTRGRCLILVVSASGSVTVARWPVPVCICTGLASTRRGGLVGESTRGENPSRPPAGLVGSAPGRPAGGPSALNERWHRRGRLVLPGRLGIWGLGCARGWSCGRHWRRLATRRAVVWPGGGAERGGRPAGVQRQNVTGLRAPVHAYRRRCSVSAYAGCVTAAVTRTRRGGRLAGVWACAFTGNRVGFCAGCWL